MCFEDLRHSHDKKERMSWCCSLVNAYADDLQQQPVAAPAWICYGGPPWYGSQAHYRPDDHGMSSDGPELTRELHWIQGLCVLCFPCSSLALVQTSWAFDTCYMCGLRGGTQWIMNYVYVVCKSLCTSFVSFTEQQVVSCSVTYLVCTLYTLSMYPSV